jgi:hypothetical protein
MAEYNRLAKHYNVMLKRNDNLLIKVKDMKRLKHIYNIMSDKQRKDAEPFPDFPEPPPPPPAPKTPKTHLEYSKPRKLNEESDIPPPPPPTPESPKVAGYAVPVAKDQNDGLNKLSDEYNKIQGLKNRKQKETLTKADKKQIKVWEERQTELKKEMHNHLDKISEEESSKLPPPPPAPDAPPTMKELANKGAIFYLEGKVISSKKAIETVNTNKNINISIPRVDSKKPIVKLSKKPISF